MPSGDESFAIDAGFRRVRGMNPGQSAQLAGLTLTALPADHNSGRMPFDQLHTQALSWSLRSDGVCVVFCRRHGLRNLLPAEFARHMALMTWRSSQSEHIRPRREVEEQHANPEEAAQIASDLGARVAVGMHWGTFPLSPEPVMQPARRFLRAKGKGVEKRVLAIGGALFLTATNRNRGDAAGINGAPPHAERRHIDAPTYAGMAGQRSWSPK